VPLGPNYRKAKCSIAGLVSDIICGGDSKVSKPSHICSEPMSRYRRNYVPGGTYFFTVVTRGRRPFLTDELSRLFLRNAIDKVRKKLPFEIVAWVLLPDHLHAIWTLPPREDDYSTRWRQIKEAFTRKYLRGKSGSKSTSSRIKKQEQDVWQRRFWEHTVEDEEDLKRCVDYIHWNPKKHGLVGAVCDWKWSTFHRFVDEGEYTRNWGRKDPTPDYNTPEWGDYET
jgi:putative transposase